MENNYLLIVLTSCAGIVGFLLRMIVDNINGILNNRKIKRIEYIEFLLSEFYMPIYILLHRENIIWNKIITSENEDHEIIKELDNENLNNHLEIQKIIMTNMAKASPRIDIAEQLIKYDEHVTIFKTLRKIGSNEFPSKYDSEYPIHLCDLIENRMKELKEDKKILLGLFGNTPILYKNILFIIDKLSIIKYCCKKNNEDEDNVRKDGSIQKKRDDSILARRISSTTTPFKLNKRESTNKNIVYTTNNNNNNNHE